MFIRHKVVNGKTYYQWVVNYRENGKVKQRVVRHIGTSEAYFKVRKEQEVIRQVAAAAKRFPNLLGVSRSYNGILRVYSEILQDEKENPTVEPKVELVRYSPADLGDDAKYEDLVQALNTGKARVVNTKKKQPEDKRKNWHYKIVVLWANKQTSA